MRRRALWLALLLLAVPLLAGAQTSTVYPCSTFRSWVDGQRLNGADLTNSFTRVGQTNMTFACLDDLSADTATMNVTVDPYPTSVASLATDGAGEMHRLRYVLKTVFGWSQWYAHTENISFGARTVTTTGAVSTGAATVTSLTTAGTVTATGAITGAATTDIVQFYAATSFCSADTPSATLVKTRLAQGNWVLARTAAGAETYNVRCDLTAPTRTTSGKGWKLTAFALSQQITVVDLTSNTFNGLDRTTYADNVATAVASHGGTITITMPTVVQANPYLTTGGVGTPAFMTTANAQIGLDWTIVMANTGVYRLAGVSATWTEQR